MKKLITIIIFIALISIIGTLFYGFSPNDKIVIENTDSVKSVAPNYNIQAVKIPTEVYFANERVPIENFDVFESLDREVLINTYWQSQTLIFIKKAKRYFPIIEKILSENGVPTDLKYIAVAESGLANVVSPANAVGFWQFLQGTATDARLEVNEEIDERYHLEKSTEAAAQFLKDSYEKYGTWSLAAASYNMGRRNISRQIERQKTDYYYDMVLGEETGRYVYRLIALKLILESPAQYGFIISDDEKYSEIPYETVQVDSTVLNWADFAHDMGINYKLLKELNPWLRDDKLTNKHKKTYNIKIASSKFRPVQSNTKFYPEE